LNEYLAKELVNALRQVGRELHEQAAPCVSWLARDQLSAILAEFGITIADIDRAAIHDRE
jgi:hypothetical protein